MSDHKEVPPEEWDGRHYNPEEDVCKLCGAETKSAGDRHGVIIRCSESDETLYLS